MFCRQCGKEIKGTEKFCPYCGKATTGAGVQLNKEPDKSREDQSQEKTKSNWQDYVTLENIERFAPAASFIPVVMALVIGILGSLLFRIFWRVWVVRNVIWVVLFLFKAVFSLTTLAAAVGLCYVAVKKKNTSLIWTWMAPAAVTFAFISCISQIFYWRTAAWIFGIAALVMGIEMFARITLANNPMDTPIQPQAAIAAYAGFYKQYKEKYPAEEKETSQTEVAVSQAPVNQTPVNEASYFDGTGAELLGYMVLGIIVSAVTCGIAAPWMICKIYKWRMSHTVVGGKRFTFDGSGASLLGHWILWEILTVITCGIYGYFMYVALRKWELKHTFLDGEPVIPGETASDFDGNSFEYLGYSLLGGLLMLVTCGIAYPWVMCMIQKWDTKHQIVNGRRFVFDGTGLAFLGQYIVIFLLSMITCGIYSPWGVVRMNKYIISHTHFAE